jgi:uncharacterized protein (TIGR00730 family)
MKEADALDNNIEQSQESAQPIHSVDRSELEAVHCAASRLLDALHQVQDGDLVGEIVANALKLLRDKTNRGDVKLIDKSFKELRYALKIFAPEYQQAADFGRLMAQAGWMVITGAGGGIMAAGHGGAGAEPSFGLAIRLPFEQATNAFIAHDPKLINFKYFFTRKLMFVRSSHAIALFPGGFGTMDEGFEVLTLVQTGKSVPIPIVFIDRPEGDYWATWEDYVNKQLLGRGLISPADRQLYKITASVEEAVREVRHFYDNYHSLRYVRDELILRLQRRPSEAQLGDISQKFADLCSRGTFRVTDALPVEHDEPALARLPRLVFTFNRRDHGTLRLLIDYLNDLPPENLTE